jgi:hypothetical protein
VCFDFLSLFLTSWLSYTLSLSLSLSVSLSGGRRVAGGQVEVAASGPTGILKEGAVQVVAAAMGKKTFDDKKRFIAEGLARCCQMVRDHSGALRLWLGVHHFNVGW